MSISTLDDLFAADLDDLESLPPVGVPPTGHYTLSVTAERKPNKENNGEYIQFTYEVIEVGEVKNAEEAADAAPGMKFSERFSPIKKDGTPNTYGIGFLKQALAPFAAHFGTGNVSELLTQIDGVTVAASLVRKADRKEPDRWNFTLSNVTVL